MHLFCVLLKEVINDIPVFKYQHIEELLSSLDMYIT